MHMCLCKLSVFNINILCNFWFGKIEKYIPEYNSNLIIIFLMNINETFFVLRLSSYMHKPVGIRFRTRMRVCMLYAFSDRDIRAILEL